MVVSTVKDSWLEADRLGRISGPAQARMTGVVKGVLAPNERVSATFRLSSTAATVPGSLRWPAYDWSAWASPHFTELMMSATSTVPSGEGAVMAILSHRETRRAPLQSRVR